ncbi:DUF1302 domain-containing protein [Arhodomonas sp. SL1]|uniref:DUF1302 domain-containing protein n=1 Tax=Arhodomonas sp. SL1 TaxID=3425691 RepID=UPI003F882FA6
MHRLGYATHSRPHPLRTVSLVTFTAGTLLAAPAAMAFSGKLSDSVTYRFDTNVKYSALWRLQEPRDELVSDVNADDGNRNFDAGLASQRLDLLSEFDLNYKRRAGLRVSAAAWWDTEYHDDTDNDSPGTYNALSVPSTEFPDETVDLHGGKVELLDGFVHGNREIGPALVSARAGQFTHLYGESLLFPDNGIASAMAPLDGIKSVSVPSSQAKELFMPVPQVSVDAQFTGGLALGAYYQARWRRTRIPAAGSLFSTADILDDGGESLLVGPGAYLGRGPDVEPDDSGEFGMAVKYTDWKHDLDLGFYFTQFHAKTPQVYIRPGVNADPGTGKAGQYTLVFPEDVRAYGASLSTTMLDANVAAEVSLRTNSPLNSGSPTLAPGETPSLDDPRHAVGKTLHAQVSFISQLGGNALWDTAELLGEVALNHRLSVDENEDMLAEDSDRTAVAFKLNLTPTHYQVRSGLDLTTPVSVSYNAIGTSSAVAGFGNERAGNVTVGVGATYDAVWQADLSYVAYFGPTGSQPLQDRDHISFNVRRTF